MRDQDFWEYSKTGMGKRVPPHPKFGKFAKILGHEWDRGTPTQTRLVAIPMSHYFFKKQSMKKSLNDLK